MANNDSKSAVKLPTIEAVRKGIAEIVAGHMVQQKSAKGNEFFLVPDGIEFAIDGVTGVFRCSWYALKAQAATQAATLERAKQVASKLTLADKLALFSDEEKREMGLL